MMPIKVLNRLELGRSVAAQVPAMLPDHRAWVRVRPLIDAARGTWVDTGHTEKRLVSTGGNPIRGYEIRYVEVADRLFENPMDISLEDVSIDQRVEVSSLDELEKMLSRWVTDLSQLRVPSIVGYVGLGR
jgi:hypothetical protein